MNTYEVDRHDGTTRTIEADDYTTGDGCVVFRDEIGMAVVMLPLVTISEVRVTADPNDPLLAARRVLAEHQREANRLAFLATAQTIIDQGHQPPTPPPNREQRRHPS
jgi:hypothetical protein